MNRRTQAGISTRIRKAPCWTPPVLPLPCRPLDRKALNFPTMCKALLISRKRAAERPRPLE